MQMANDVVLVQPFTGEGFEKKKKKRIYICDTVQINAIKTMAVLLLNSCFWCAEFIHQSPVVLQISVQTEFNTKRPCN